MSSRRARRSRDKRRRHAPQAAAQEQTEVERQAAVAEGTAAPEPPARPRSRDKSASSRGDVRGERPAPLWGSFPLSEIAIAVGVAVGAVGVVLGQERGQWPLLAGIGLCVLAVLEITAREHFSGYRSHAVILAVLAVALLQLPLVVATGGRWRGPLAVGIDMVLIAGVALSLRRRFRRVQVRRMRRRRL